MTPRHVNPLWQRVWPGISLLLVLGVGPGACKKAQSSEPARAEAKPGGELKGPPKVTVVSPEPTTGGDVIMGTLVPNRQITVTPEDLERVE